MPACGGIEDRLYLDSLKVSFWYYLFCSLSASVGLVVVKILFEPSRGMLFDKLFVFPLCFCCCFRVDVLLTYFRNYRFAVKAEGNMEVNPHQKIKCKASL